MSDQPHEPHEGVTHPVARLCRRFADRLDELVDPGSLTLWSATDTEVAEVVQAAEQVLRKAAAVQTTAVAEAARRDLAKTVGATSTTAWLADLLTARRARARQITDLADHLSCGLGATTTAFAAGDIDADQAGVIAEAVRKLPDSLGAEVIGQGEQLMLGWARQHPAPVLAGYGQHLLAYLAPEVADAADAEALARDEARDARDASRANTLSAGPGHRGRIRLRGDLDPEAWALVSAALEPFAKPGGLPAPDGADQPDCRTAAQRNADALVEICRRSLAADDTPTSFGFPAHVAVTIGYDQLVQTVGVGTLDTGTPISAETVRRFACDATILPVLLNSAGVPLDVGRAIRVFTKELRRAVEVRDRGCAFPGCDRPASWCNVHHIVHWVDGGPTSLDNGVLLCGAHHKVIHRREWTVRLGTDRRPAFTPPTWIDPDQQPRTDTLHLRR